MADGYFKGKKIFVTGASGLVGSWLVKEMLSEGSDIVCLIRDSVPGSMFFSEGLDKKVTIARGELESLQDVERAINEYEPEAVIHLGAQAIVSTANNSPLGTFNSNVKGTWNVLEACRLHDKTVKSIVVASSDKAYGEQEKLPYTEDSPLNAENPYDASKACADILAKAYGRTYSMPVSISRCGNFFGGGDMNFSRIVPATIKNTLANKPTTIRSDGSYVRDYIYVKDAVSAYMLLSKKTEEMKLGGDAFNFSNEIQLTVLEMVSKIMKLMGKSIKPIIKDEASGEIRKQHLSAKKAREMLGWKSEWGIDKGLDETIGWYTDYFKKNK